MRYLVFLTIVLASCSKPDYLTKEELQTYLMDESNELSRSKKVGPLEMKVTHRPNDFLIWQEVEGESDTTAIKEAMKRYDNYLYFMMQLSAGEKDALYALSSNQADFNEKLQTLSFRMGQFVNLTTSNQDTIPVADFYYTRMFGLSSSNDILFVFNNSKVGATEWVSLNTKEFGFKSGRQSFRFDVNTMNSTPGLMELKPFESLR